MKILTKIDGLGRRVFHTPAYELLMRRVRAEGACLVVTGARNANGYGMASLSRGAHGTRLAHRVVWEHHNGPIPPGLLVMHTCDNPPCVDLTHLRLGTHAENSQDMVNKGRGVRLLEACRRGHPRTPENTRREGKSTRCVVCQREYARTRRTTHPAWARENGWEIR